MTGVLSHRVLVLNKAWLPVDVVSVMDAVSKVFSGRALCVDPITYATYEFEDWVDNWGDAIRHSKVEANKVISAPSLSLLVPEVILHRTHQHGNRAKARPKFSRRNVYVRDGYKCFGAGTLILMGDGQQKPIEDVSKGDMVVDAYGQLQQVVETGRRWAEDVVEMTSRGSCLKTIVTKDHPYLSSSGEFKPIGEWDVVEGRQRWEGDYLVFPREVDYAFQGKAYVRTSDYFTDEWMKYRNGRIYWTKRPHESGFPVVLDVTEDWAYFLGLYCAEGSATKGGLVALSFSMSEVDTLAQDAKVFLESLGLNVAVDTFPEKNTVIVRTGSKTLARVLRKACGSGSHKKKVPFGMIDSQREHFLRGVILGDGHITESKSVLNVASWGLIRDIQGLSWGLGMFPTLQKSERPDGRVSWHLVYQGESYHRLMSIVRQTEQVADWTFGNDQFVFRKLTGVTDTEPTMVYNLETTGSHSYIANGLSVHNCQYCGKKFDSSELNIDHVKPTSRGGKTTWTNTVLSCIPCNDRKANRTPEEAGMRLLREPHVPSSEEVRRGYLQRVMSRISYKPPSWEALLGDMYWNVQLKA